MLVDVSRSLFTDDIPLLDVRAPVEFHRGAFPHAFNAPILDDSEREQVGTAYKREGPEAAVALGHRLVSGEVKAARVRHWAELARSHPGLHLYCFRGGQRSGIAEAWLAEAGFDIPRIKGGYKAMRNFLLSAFEALPHMFVVGGKTGTGKSELLRRISELDRHVVVDLEALANHRGSAFGRRQTPQPAQIDFENRTAIALLKAHDKIVVEDEGRMVGRCNIPIPLQTAMGHAPILVLEDTLTRRAERIVDEYVTCQVDELVDMGHGTDEALALLRAQFLGAIDAIKKRLGGVNYQAIRPVIESAFDAHEKGDTSGHLAWVEALLVNYYDPMYEYQLSKKADRVCVTGDAGLLFDRLMQLLRP